VLNGLLPSWLALAVAVAAPPPPDHSDYRQKCSIPVTANNSVRMSWTPATSMLDRHLALRSGLGAAVPQGASRILGYENGGHMGWQASSVIAVRGDDGRWRVSGIGKSGIAIANSPTQEMPSYDREMSAEESASLDRAIEDPCLYLSPTNTSETALGGPEGNLEVDVPGHHWIGYWFAFATPQEARIIELLGPR
jgi:hypothetical protein